MTDDPEQDMMPTCLWSFCKHLGVFFPSILRCFAIGQKKNIFEAHPFGNLKSCTLCQKSVYFNNLFLESAMIKFVAIGRSIFRVCGSTSCSQIITEWFILSDFYLSGLVNKCSSCTVSLRLHSDNKLQEQILETSVFVFAECMFVDVSARVRTRQDIFLKTL